MNTTRVTENAADALAGEPDEPSGSSLSEPRQRIGRAPVADRDRRHAPVARGMANGPTIEIRDETGRLSPMRIAWLGEHAELALAEALARHGQSEPTPGDAVRAVILGDNRMADLHERLCGVAGTTDVITIDPNRAASESAGRATRPMDIELLLCLDEAMRQSTHRGHATEHELLLYVVHGILHCLGHGDHDDAGFEAMHAMEDAILSAIGVGAVFGGDQGEGET